MIDSSYAAVYYVTAPHSSLDNSIAIRPCFFSYNTEESIERRCEWQDAGRGNYFYYERLIAKDTEKPPLKFKLIAKDGSQIKFIRLTARLFQEKLAEKVWGNKRFSTDQELQAYYLNTPFSSY